MDGKWKGARKKWGEEDNRNEKEKEGKVRNKEGQRVIKRKKGRK
jgi:hypothetical protein